MAGAIPSAKSSHWGTPPDILDMARRVMGPIKLDPCANAHAATGETNYILPANDGLKDSWNFPSSWVNPPFGPVLDKWMTRCVKAHEDHGSTVMAILPASTETRWFQHQIFQHAHGICFTRRRVKFVPNVLTPLRTDQPTKGHAVVYYGHDPIRFIEVFSELGSCLCLEYPTAIESVAGEHAPCSACGWPCDVAAPLPGRPGLSFTCRCGKTMFEF